MTPEQEMALLRVIADLRINLAQRENVIDELRAQLAEAPQPKES